MIFALHIVERVMEIFLLHHSVYSSNDDDRSIIFPAKQHRIRIRIQCSSLLAHLYLQKVLLWSVSQSIVYLPLTMFRHFGFTMLNRRKEASRGILRDCEIFMDLRLQL